MKCLNNNLNFIGGRGLVRLIFNTIVIMLIIVGSSLSSFTMSAPRDHAAVGVASNFMPTIEALKKDFEQKTTFTLIIIAGATGKLYAQIRHGAPIDVFLAADQARPEQLDRDGLTVPGSRFCYVTGRLAVWFPNRTPNSERQEISQKDAVALLRDSPRIAHANAAVAPYGLASVQTLQALGLIEEVKSRIVRGENIGQTFGIISSGNADAGFIALTQAVQQKPLKTSFPAPRNGQYWLVNATLHEPIYQDAVLLRRAANNPAAKAFMSYLRSPAAREIMRVAGYSFSDQRP